MNLFGQVGLPDPNQPDSGSLWNQIFGPLMPLLEGAWWWTLHLVLPIVLIAGVVGMIFASIAGNRAGAARARGVIFSVPLALFLVSGAVLVSNWIIGHYPS